VRANPVHGIKNLRTPYMPTLVVGSHAVRPRACSAYAKNHCGFEARAAKDFEPIHPPSLPTLVVGGSTSMFYICQESMWIRGSCSKRFPTYAPAFLVGCVLHVKSTSMLCTCQKSVDLRFSAANISNLYRAKLKKYKTWHTLSCSVFGTVSVVALI